MLGGHSNIGNVSCHLWDLSYLGCFLHMEAPCHWHLCCLYAQISGAGGFLHPITTYDQHQVLKREKVFQQGLFNSVF